MSYDLWAAGNKGEIYGFLSFLSWPPDQVMWRTGKRKQSLVHSELRKQAWESGKWTDRSSQGRVLEGQDHHRKLWRWAEGPVQHSAETDSYMHFRELLKVSKRTTTKDEKGQHLGMGHRTVSVSTSQNGEHHSPGFGKSTRRTTPPYWGIIVFTLNTALALPGQI